MELKLPAPCLIVLVGPSGSGKSTWAAEHFQPGEVVSSDKLRAMVGSGEHDQTASPAAFEVLERIVDERLSRRLTVVIDTLGFDKETRLRWIEKAHASGMPAYAVVFDTPAEVCEERNRARAKPIPRSVLRRQISRFPGVLKALQQEPFDGIHRQQPIAVVAPGMAATPAPTPASSPGRRPPTHTFGLTVPRFDWKGPDYGKELAEVARRAEAAGFRDIWVMDHFRQIRGIGRPWEDLPEAYTSLAYMAAATKTIRLGTMVTSVTHRPPIVLGKMVATLDVLSGGRANCGLGAGWDEAEHASYGIGFPELRVRFALLEETLQMLPLLWGKGTPAFSGEYIESPELICYPRPIQEKIPILVGGGGERRTLRLVAQYADACNVFGDPARVRHKTGVLEAHCEQVGRDPATVEVTHLTSALPVADRASLRKEVDRLRDRNTSAEAYMARHNAGTVDDLLGLFTSYAEAGASHSVVSLPTVWEEGSIEIFADVIASFAHP